ncbi:hypothetical protein GW17_00010992 [Ensete ventricosum]|nr:hypothetical protein GW17_00010992 [Ensete ventricosum]
MNGLAMGQRDTSQSSGWKGLGCFPRRPSQGLDELEAFPFHVRSASHASLREARKDSAGESRDMARFWHIDCALGIAFEIQGP